MDDANDRDTIKDAGSSTPRGSGDRLAVDQEFAARFPLVVASQHAGERVQQGRLAGTGCAEEQHA